MPRTLKAWPCDATGPVEANKAHYERHLKNPDKWGPICVRSRLEQRAHQANRRRKAGQLPRGEVDWSAVVKKGRESMGRAARKAAKRKADATIGPVGRRAAAAKALSTKGLRSSVHDCGDLPPERPTAAQAVTDRKAGRPVCATARAAAAWKVWLQRRPAADPSDYWTERDNRRICEVYRYDWPLTAEVYVGMTSGSAESREDVGYDHNPRLVELIESGVIHTRTVVAAGLTRPDAYRREWAEMEQIVDEGRLALVNIKKPTNRKENI